MTKHQNVTLGEKVESNIQEIVEQELQTARQRAEEYEKLKAALLTNISHEIRTPLNAILGFSELLANPLLTNDRREEFVRLSRINAQKLLDTITNLLDTSKLESGEWPVHEAPVKLPEQLTDFFLRFKNEVETTSSKNVEFRLNIASENLSTRLWVDIELLQKVLYNLMTNAVKYTSSGSIELGCEYQSGKSIQLYVRDTGSGIAKEKQGMIFEPFRHTNEHFPHAPGGLGLGLAVCKKLLKVMGGEIRVESEEDNGATFYVTIPYKPVDQA